MAQHTMIFNLDTCQDQRNCMVACKAKKCSFLGSHFIETFTSTTGEFPNPNTYFIPVTCQHCSDPLCVAACKEAVIYKREDGIVALGETSKCTGCESKACIDACRFHAIDLDPVTGQIGKCDMCADDVDAGRVPACMASCLSHSTFFGDKDDPNSVVAQILSSWGPSGCVHQLDVGDGNKPSVYYLLSRKEWKNLEGLRGSAWRNHDVDIQK